MKALIIWPEGFDIPNPSNHLLSALLQDITDSGFHVKLIQARRNKHIACLPEELIDNNRLIVENIDRRVVDKKKFILRYIEEASYAFRCLLKWVLDKDFDIVLLGSCPTIVFQVLLTKVFSGRPVIYYLQDVFPGSAVKSGVISNRIIKKIFEVVQRIAYTLSDRIIVISEDMKKRLQEQGVNGDKIATVVNWVDDSKVTEIAWSDNKFVAMYSLNKSKFYVQYAGTFGYVFDYLAVVKVAKELRNDPDIIIQMVGDGSQKEAFEKLVSAEGLENVQFLPLQPLKLVADVYSAASVCLIPLKRGVIGNSVPSKAALIMKCNRVIINSVDSESDYHKMFNEKGIGFSFDQSDICGMCKKIRELKNDISQRRKVASAARLFGEKYYSRSDNTDKIINLLHELIVYKAKEI